MGKSTSNGWRRLFLVHAIGAAAIGAPLWVVPGRTLTLIGWVPELVQLPESALSVPGVTFANPAFVRLVGAALLALALASYWGWRARQFDEVRLLVRLETVFSILGALAILVVAFRGVESFPAIGWLGLGILVFFALAWGWALRKEDQLARGSVQTSADGVSAIRASSIEAPSNYLQNLEETIGQLRRLANILPEGKLRDQMLDEVGALAAIADVTKLALDAMDEDGGR